MVLAGTKAVFDRVIRQKKGKPAGLTKAQCEYFKGGHSNDFCRATTQTECRKCRAYAPNMQERRSLLAEYILELEKKNEDLSEEVEHLWEKVNGMTDQIEEFKVFAKLVEQEVRGEEDAEEEKEEEEDGKGDSEADCVL